MVNNNKDDHSSNSNALRTDPYFRKKARISDIAYVIKRNLLLISVCALVGLALGIILSIVSYLRGEMSKQYNIKSTIAFTTQNERGQFVSHTANPSSTDIHLAEDMTDAVIYVLKSEKMLNKVIDETGLLGVTTRDISSNLVLAQYNKTQIIDITLYWRSATEGVEILQALNSAAPSVLLETLKIGRVSVINEPKARYLIGGSFRIALWGYMMVVGIMLGIVISVMGLLIRPTLLDPTDLERDFHIELIGDVPENKKFFDTRKIRSQSTEGEELYRDVKDSYMSIAQIFKTRIRGIDHPCIYLTSADQNEGRTSLTAYLGTYLSELGMKVLMVDLDTKNPKLGGLFLDKVEYERSINALYHGDCSKEAAVISVNGKLDLLPAVLERQALVYDDALFELISGFKNDYDVVLMDTAPVGQVADTLSLNDLADYCLLVVRFDGPSWDSIRDAISRMYKSDTRILGGVVNGTKHLINTRKISEKSSGKNGRTGKPRKKVEKSARKQEWEEWEKEHAEQPEQAADSENAENSEHSDPSDQAN